MKRKARIGQLETRLIGPGPREPFDWEAVYVEIGLLTRDCIGFFWRTASRVRNDGHLHQLMRVGTFALTDLTGSRPVRHMERDALRQLMTDPECRGFGWSEVKHPKVLRLYRQWAARGWLAVGG